MDPPGVPVGRQATGWKRWISYSSPFIATGAATPGGRSGRVPFGGLIQIPQDALQASNSFSAEKEETISASAFPY